MYSAWQSGKKLQVPPNAFYLITDRCPTRANLYPSVTPLLLAVPVKLRPPKESRKERENANKLLIRKMWNS